jgi:hypothetical protein
LLSAASAAPTALRLDEPQRIAASARYIGEWLKTEARYLAS